ncbi:stressosome-associated protein Prli42 [Pseudoneobacillus sp. C159]
MSNKKRQKIIVYLMLGAMLASTILIGISSFL